MRIGIGPAALALAGTLLGCTMQPYATLPAPAQPGDAGTRVAICYNGVKTPEPAVLNAAQGECPAATTAQRAETDYSMQVCPVLLPARATFICVPRK